MSFKCEYCQIPGAYGNLIYDTDYWLIYLAPSQRYLGTCVVALKRQCSSLNELQSEEWSEFTEIVQNMEITLKKTFNPTLFNWSCFMNSAYRVSSPNPEVHWHFIPRYNKKVEFEGLIFEDPDFGYIPQPLEHKIPDEVMKKLMAEIKKNLR
ncbi:MAG: HIT family protein [Methanobacterium sp.]|uniref:HIT family protein n=1 Tax=Methanobacterium sp. TaxID=2164 RepID=UPI003D652C6F|nr:HIT family protein [Methanobacterium sp.]